MSNFNPRWRLIMLGLGLACIIFQPYLTFGCQAANLSDDFLQLKASFAEKLSAVANDYQTQGKTDLAAATRAWIAPRDPSRRYLYLPPDNYQDPPFDLIAQRSGADPEWSRVIRQHRETYSHELYGLAGVCADQNNPRLLGQVLWEALWQNPDHASVRQILDYRIKKNPPDQIVVRVSRRAEPQLGWRSGGYREGSSANFRLLTNAGEPDALALLERLEIWRTLWRQTTFAYWLSKDKTEVAKAVHAGRKLPTEPEIKHQVVLFAKRQDFLQALARVARIEESVGYFDADAGRCYFYLDPNDPNVLATQLHEMVHQLFQETGRRVRQVGEKGNFWLLEGAAMYFESLQPLDAIQNPFESRLWSIGGFDAQRLQFARLRWQREGYFVPFDNLVRRGRRDFQSDPELSRLYSQCAGMFHFLMHESATTESTFARPNADSQEVSLPDAALAMLQKSYTGRDRVDMLEAETLRSLAKLERDYKQWLTFSAAASGDFLTLANDKRELALGLSELTDANLIPLSADALTLLQLSGTKITDAALQTIAQKHHQFRFLYLDQCDVGDAGVIPLIQANTHLESLDLANTKITDATLMACRDLRELEDLWLTRTAVTDAAVPWLLALPKLKVLDVQGTQISPQFQQQLQQRFK